ncbi:protein amnionless-like [Cephus cinctus]|uniref:Protein amnionless n=1 Tax=Cephus cinctus TaxID=211228 RepID=A0AAJ7FS57_CEPCN|nr:protein amnionless-like [Cephus cinctus]
MIRLLVLVLHPYLVQSLEKYWLPDLEWQTAGNWEEGHVPEEDSHVIFPEEMRHAAGFPIRGDFRLSDVHLPRDGSLVLPAKGKLELSIRKSDQQKEARWSRTGELPWADTNNWNYSSEAVPHMDRIPCFTDTMVLPARNKTFSIRLPRHEVQVKGVRLANERETFTSLEWKSMKRNHEFVEGYFTVRYGDLLSCKDCECQSKKSELWKEVCEIEMPRCGLSVCAYPLKVEGHCCLYCGARVSLSPTVSLGTVEDAVRETVGQSGMQVAWYVRKRWNDEREILLVETGVYDGLTSAKAADMLAARIRDYGIDVVSVELTGPALLDSRLPLTLGPFFGMAVLVLIFMMIIFPYYGYSYRQVSQSSREAWTSIRERIRSDPSRISRPFGFARFENATDANVELASSPGQDDVEDQEQTSSTGGRFTNPLYSSKRGVPEDKTVLNVEGTVTMASLRDTVDNDEFVEAIETDLKD